MSNRFAETALNIPEAMSIKVNNLVYELKAQGREVTVLSLGEAFFEIPLFSFDALPFPACYHYSHSRGIPELRQKLANYFDSKYDFPFDPAREIVVTAGSKAAIHMTLMALLDPGDEVLIPEPAWVSFREQVRLCHGVPVGLALGASVSDIESAITARTKVLIINNPHNPRGYVYTRSELEDLFDLAARRKIWLLCDEAYSDFVDDGGFVSLGTIDREKRHSVVFNSISKNFGISGWRIGYAIGSEDLINQVLKINQHLITCPPTILQYYVANYFDRILEITRPQIDALCRKRRDVAAYMASIGIEAMPGASTFYFFVSIGGSSVGSEEFAVRLLDEEGVSVVPGVGYGSSCDRFVRISIGTESLMTVMGALDKMRRLIDRLTPAGIHCP